MIKIKDNLPDYSLCTSCRSDNECSEITISYDNGMFKQGTQITLCKDCRKKLFDLLEWNLEKK